jgi:Ca2+-binding EF-hand superfamily protein
MFKDRDIDRTGKIPVREFERVVEQLDMRLLREEQRAIVDRFGSRGSWTTKSF